MFVRVVIQGSGETEDIEEVLNDYGIHKQYYGLHNRGRLATCVIQLEYASDLWNLQKRLGCGIRLLNDTNYDLIILA